MLRGHRIVVSAITYSEIRFGVTNPKSSPRHVLLVDTFFAPLDAVLPWVRAAVDANMEIKVARRQVGMPVDPNHTGIAGHAIAAGGYWLRILRVWLSGCWYWKNGLTDHKLI